MDTADRFVNCKCVKYLLRMDQTDEAIKLAGFFTRVSWVTAVPLLLPFLLLLLPACLFLLVCF